MTGELQEIYKPIKKDLASLEITLKQIFYNGNNKFVRSIGEYVIRVPGKRLRPALVLLSSRFGNYQAKPSVMLAAAVELIHTATLIHDDIIDKADIRRKQLSVNVKYGSEAAILFGDYLYSKAFEAVSSLKSNKITNILLETATKICEGEMDQLNNNFKPKTTVKKYLQIISGKTAALFAACCEVGGVLSGLPANKTAFLKEYGLKLGICFQIMDDCLDVAGDEKIIGKSVDIDLKGGRATLPNIYLNKFPDKSKIEAVSYSREVGRRFGKEAKESLGKMPENESKSSLIKLVDFVLGQLN